MGSELRCRLCGAHADVQLVDGQVTCRACGAIFHGSGSPPPASVPLPSGIVAKETQDSLFIGIRWFRPMHLFPIAGGILLCMALAVFFKEFVRGNVHWTGFLLAPAPYLAFGLIAIYWSLAFLLNRTHLWVRDKRITVRQVPLPVRRSRRIDVSDVDQLFTLAEYDKSRQVVSCDVCLFRKNGRWFRLVKNLAREDQALFLEWAIERHLGIRDEPVMNELRRRPPA
jgi:hypothetical protein